MKEINKIYNQLSHRYRRSFILYTSLSVAVFSLSAVLVILNLFAVRMNPNRTLNDASLKHEQWYFIAIIALTAISGAISGALSLFTFKKRARYQQEQIDKINREIKNYKGSLEEYKRDGVNKDKKFIRNIQEILDSE